MQIEDHFAVGYLDFPRLTHRPLAGTPEETSWSRGWSKAQFDLANADETLEQEYLAGRDTFAVEYWAGG